jgi:hypothetical protein
MLDHEPDVRHDRYRGRLGLRQVPVDTARRAFLHKTPADCLRAVDAELKSLIVRARQLSVRRAVIAMQSMLKFEQFRKRSES